MEKFINKKILFFAPKFFNYEIEIKKKLEQLGAEVDFYDERMNPTNLDKVIIRLKKDLLKIRINKYYLEIIEKSKKNKYDYILFISPETITKELLEKFRESQKTSKFILYMWDSIKNKKNVQEIIECFDSHFSFDKSDCEIDSRFRFRPLFYLDEYSKLAQNKKELKNDISFIGTVHSDRYSIIKYIKCSALENNLRVNFYMYFPSKVIYFIKKIFDKSYKNTDMNDFSFTSISKNEVLDIISSSKAILDIQHPKQVGLTMRTIEMLGMKKKLITTNKDIINYDFYDSNNIKVIDRDNPILDLDFIKNDYIEINVDIYKKYSIGSWLEEIFSE
ncbi:hypothetical protein [Cetobacterium sp.]|uniref:hypothetical protein n=1 Tax=Cetobacterium sp. TaxID=2071632 RepID=UPI003F2E2FFA